VQTALETGLSAQLMRVRAKPRIRWCQARGRLSHASWAHYDPFREEWPFRPRGKPRRGLRVTGVRLYRCGVRGSSLAPETEFLRHGGQTARVAGGPGNVIAAAEGEVVEL
jgi:hypothetical protein